VTESKKAVAGEGNGLLLFGVMTGKSHGSAESTADDQ